jgi:DNA-binding FrmR family transcriptional regulator
MTHSHHPEQPAAVVTRGYSAAKDQLLTRIRRVEGQVRGIAKMVEDDRYCIGILTQISAIQAALDEVGLGLLDDHARHCMRQGSAEGRADEMTTEMMAAVGRLMQRG